MLTEKEARKKWCPFARVVSVVDRGTTVAAASVNREFASGIADKDCLCIASDCMAWATYPSYTGDEERGTCLLLREK